MPLPSYYTFTHRFLLKAQMRKSHKILLHLLKQCICNLFSSQTVCEGLWVELLWEEAMPPGRI